MFKNFLAASISLLVTLSVLEFALRILENSQYKNDIFQKYKEVYSDERDQPYLFGHHSNVDVYLGDEESGFRFITNADGLREVKDYKDLDASVIFLGDSIIEGSSANNDETIDSIFEKETGFVSLNMGVGSSNTVHQLRFLQGKYKESYNAKLLILGVCLNDIKHNYFLRYFDPELGNWKKYSDYQRTELDADTRSSVETDYMIGATKRFILKSKLVQFVYFSLFPVSEGELYLDTEFTQSEVDNAAELVKDIKKFTDEKNIALVVTIFPTRSQISGNLINQGVQHSLYSALEMKSITTVHLDELMDKATKTYGTEKIWHDNVHPTPLGYKLVAEYLAHSPEIVDVLQSN